MDSQWNYQEQPEHVQTIVVTWQKGYNPKHGRNSRGMGSQVFWTTNYMYGDIN